MEKVVAIEEYIPSVDAEGKYFDHVGTWSHSMKCMCGGRGEGVYETRTKFTAHCRTKCHQEWLAILTMSNQNYYNEVIKLRKLTDDLTHLVAKLSNDLSAKTLAYDSLKTILKEELAKPSNSDIDV